MIGPQAGQTFGRGSQFLCQGRIEGRQVPNTAVPVRQRPPVRPLPIKEIDGLSFRIDKYMLGVQIGMIEAGCVQASQGLTEAMSKTTAADPPREMVAEKLP
jgi:hypothetical protein